MFNDFYVRSLLVGAICTALITLSLAHQSSAAEEDSPLRQELAASPHKIIFERYAVDNWDLFVMNADGSNLHNLTNTPDIHELYPHASPDGKRICFLVDVGEGRETVRSVYLMNVDGSGRQLIAEKSRQPCWSPDGRKIAFVPQEFRRFNIADYASRGLRIYDIETQEIQPAANDANIEHLYNLTWSRDGKWIVATVHGGMGFGHAILAIEVDGDRVVDLKIKGCRPTISLDGTRITWSSDDHTVNVADFRTEGIPQVENIGIVHQHEKLHLYHPDFSPDGSLVSWSMGPGGRMPVNGPGTHSAVAEMVGARGPWDIFVRRIGPRNGVGPIVQLTAQPDASNKESEWLPIRSQIGSGGAR